MLFKEITERMSMGCELQFTKPGIFFLSRKDILPITDGIALHLSQ